MPEGVMSVVSLPFGSVAASTSNAQVAPITIKGGVSASAVQGTSLLSKGGASTSGAQTNSLPSRGGQPTSAFQVASNAPQTIASASGFQGAVNPCRQRFHVELREGETNVVSWKKLLKDAQKNALPVTTEAPVGANPALEARLAPERAGLSQTNIAVGQEPLQPTTNRFNSVIEKIERLYKGVDSEEEEDAYVSLDESQYDSDDGFIDDTELDEYFSVDTAKTKHTGFFVNRGKLEKVNESPPPPLPPVHVPRKRKRNVMKLSSEIVAGEFAKKRVNIGLRLKDAARKTPGPATPGGEVGTSTIFRTSETSSMAKPQKRVKPLLDERDKNVEPISGLSANHISKENLRDSGKVEEVKDSDSKIQNTVVELSDDDNDLEKVLRPNSDAKEGVGLDTIALNRQTGKLTENSEAALDVRNLASKSVKASVEEKLVMGEHRETGSPVALPKIKKNQQPIKDEESKDTEGSGKPPSTCLTSSPGTKEVSPKKSVGWPKGTVLERAINDLEKGVAEAFPLTGDRQEAIENAESGGKSKRLPREVKQKLAKVARLAAKKGKIPDELIDRLMNIIGHVMRLKTLKRNLKAMVEMGLNAKQEKDVRLQDMKREVTELVKSRVSTFPPLDADLREGSSDDFQASKDRRPIKRRIFKWDEATEDRICDLYDNYVEGMDEHKGPQIRKLYVELAELWPDGWMDNHGIKNAVFRAKERRKKQNKLKMGEEKRRKKAALLTDKQKADRETVFEKQPTTAPASSFVPPLIKGPPSKEKLTIKSSKQRVDERSQQLDDQSKHTDEEGRRLAVMAASYHGMLFPRKHLADPGTTRDQSVQVSNLVKKNPILKDETVKAKRTDDGMKLSRKLPRKSFEGKIVEHLARKRPRNESVENDTLEALRSSKNSLLNSPLLKSKKKKLRPSSDGKPYPPLKVSPSTMKATSNPDRLVNGGHPSQSRVSAVSSFTGPESERVRDVARWPSEASRLMNE